MTKVEFDRYPKVPNTKHYPLPVHMLTIQEKLDGANAGIQLDSAHPGSVLIHSRTRALMRMREGARDQLVDDVGSFGLLFEYVAARLPGILAFMQTTGVTHIYGEWLVKHTLAYPDEMWRHFYVFDLEDERGYLNPHDLEDDLTNAGLLFTRAADLDAPSLEAVKALAAQWSAERRMEGVVVKAYGLDAQGELDGWGQRYAYKYVFPEFSEEHKANPLFPPPLEALTVEQRLAGNLPERSIEKVFQKVCDARGGWKPQHFPMLLGLTWQEFLEEHAVSAFKEHGHPTVNIRLLKGEVERRAREYALAQRPA